MNYGKVFILYLTKFQIGGLTAWNGLCVGCSLPIETRSL